MVKYGSYTPLTSINYKILTGIWGPHLVLYMYNFKYTYIYIHIHIQYLNAFGVFLRPPWKELSCKPQKALAQAQQEQFFCVKHGVCEQHGFCFKQHFV